MSMNCVHMLLDLLFKHITNVSVYFMEKFDVLSSRYRHVRKMQLHLVYLLYLFIQYLKRIIHQSFVSTAPTYGDSRGIAGVRYWTNYCFDCPRSTGEVWVLWHWDTYPAGIFCCVGLDKEQGYYHQCVKLFQLNCWWQFDLGVTVQSWTIENLFAIAK